MPLTSSVTAVASEGGAGGGAMSPANALPHASACRPSAVSEVPATKVPRDIGVMQDTYPRANWIMRRGVAPRGYGSGSKRFNSARVAP